MRRALSLSILVCALAPLSCGGDDDVAPARGGSAGTGGASGGSGGGTAGSGGGSAGTGAVGGASGASGGTAGTGAVGGASGGSAGTGAVGGTAGSATGGSAGSGGGAAGGTGLGNRPALLDDLVGFAEGTTGGKDGALCEVTNLDDSGPGSLRSCAEASGPAWIVFNLSGTIKLQSAIRVASDKTIDGRGQSITITDNGLTIDAVSNVIIENLIIKDGNDDAIRVIDGADKVWIDHCSISNFTDGAIDITVQATDVTVSWCKFTNHDKTMLISANDSHTQDSVIRVTLHHNYFLGTVQRHPRLRFGKVHAFNNLLEDWQGYGMRIHLDGELLSESNIFDAGSDKDAIVVGSGSPSPHIESRNDLALNGAVIDENDPNGVFEAKNFYSYTLETADSALQSKITAQAGWRDITP